MNPLTCAIAYCTKDAAITKQLLEWINEMGGAERHPCLLVVDSKVPPAEAAFIKMAAENAFASVEEIQFVEGPLPKVLRWPPWRYQANRMFLRAAKHVFDCYRGPFLWLEPDSIPLVPNWLDKLSESYYAQPRKYHGPIIRISGERQAHMPEVHMAGVAIYPNTAAHALERFCGGEHTWDLGGSVEVVPKATKCRLIQHTYSPPGADENTGWTFHFQNGSVVAEGVPDIIRDGVVLYHRCKDGSLIRALRMESAPRSNGHTSETKAAPQAAPARPKQSSGKPFGKRPAQLQATT